MGSGSLPPKDGALETALILNELQGLEKQTLRFDDPLAEALAKAEIADAAWPLDEALAKELLRAAHALAMPKENQAQGLKRPTGAPPPPPDAASRARLKVRLRILEVARRDKALLDELMKAESETFGAFGEHYASSALADQALEAGDAAAAADYVLRGIKADPTQGASVEIINRIAMRDRAEADRLALLYIDELRRFPLTSQGQSDIRTFGILSTLANATVSHEPKLKIPPPGPAVMRAYVAFMLEALGGLEQREPGYLKYRRRSLLNLWVPLQKYAPELVTAFTDMETRSRTPGQTTSLPTAAGIEEERRARYEKTLRDGLSGERPDEGAIYAAMGRGEFDAARKMIAKLPDETRRRPLYEAASAEEAMGLAAKGNIDSAEALAKELRSTASVRKVYPLLISRSLAKKDKARAARMVYQALQQVKDTDPSAPPPPGGIPASAVAHDTRFDPALSFMAELALVILPADGELALEVLAQLVAASNATHAQKGRSFVGFDAGVFKALAPGNEAQVKQAAYSLSSPVTRVLALASFFQWKSREICAARAPL